MKPQTRWLCDSSVRLTYVERKLPARSTMTVSVLVSGEAVPISRAVFTTLLDNSVAGTYVGYENALNSGSI